MCCVLLVHVITGGVTLSVTALNKLIEKLDCRIEKKENNGGKRRSGFIRYKRIRSSPARSGPPCNPPSWAVGTQSSG